ncbi:hypothetical protein Tco_0303578, partial [Tanacetum coccineum]
MKHQTELLNLKAHAEKRSKSLEQRADAMGRTDALRSLANALGQWADEYLRKSDAYGQRAEASISIGIELKESVKSQKQERIE